SPFSQKQLPIYIFIRRKISPIAVVYLILHRFIIRFDRKLVLVGTEVLIIPQRNLISKLWLDRMAAHYPGVRRKTGGRIRKLMEVLCHPVVGQLYAVVGCQFVAQ